MPTMPPGPERVPGSEAPPHLHRRMAESFGMDPERYDRARPRYPDALVARIVAAAPGPAVLDVGIGTGIAARQFRAAGCDVLGVEVDARMAAWARGRGLDVEVAAFEDWDPAGRAFDAVVAAQTWHWVDPVAGAVKAAEALRPGGRLALFWNVELPPSEIAEAFAEVYRRMLPDSLAARRWASGSVGHAALCAGAEDGIRAAGGFDEPERWHFDWARRYTRDEWLDQLPTTGDHTRLPAAEMAALSAAVGAVVDASGGAFTMRYTAVAVTASRTGVR
ncbi:class I SAM-dependent methyltransferase (plasmid) [Embleya sp. NBC_00888]|uniref:class I SAM-dependent methyltransferase n=1 Tax=Embleya sp. NBC_00888 TaxID=2975960 RepID=UPI002F90A645|nr:class I SAM-dependent methyltransferase [Embleya sp. NBC_00888]